MKGAFLLSYLNNIARIEGHFYLIQLKRTTSIGLLLSYFYLRLDHAASLRHGTIALLSAVFCVRCLCGCSCDLPAALPKVRWHTRHCGRFRPWGPASSLLMDRPASASTIVWLCLSAWNSSLRFVRGTRKAEVPSKVNVVSNLAWSSIFPHAPQERAFGSAWWLH